jgi:hypothetical protein
MNLTDVLWTNMPFPNDAVEKLLRNKNAAREVVANEFLSGYCFVRGRRHFIDAV